MVGLVNVLLVRSSVVSVPTNVVALVGNVIALPAFVIFTVPVPFDWMFNPTAASSPLAAIETAFPVAEFFIVIWLTAELDWSNIKISAPLASAMNPLYANFGAVNVLFESVIVDRAVTKSPPSSGSEIVISEVTASGALNLTLLVPLSEFSKNSIKPALVLPFLTWIEASCIKAVPIIVGLSRVLLVNVIVLESVAAVNAVCPFIFTTPVPFGTKFISMSVSSPSALIDGAELVALFVTLKWLTALALPTANVKYSLPLGSTIFPASAIFGAVNVLFVNVTVELAVITSELLINTFPLPFALRLRSILVSSPSASIVGPFVVAALLTFK